MEMYSFAVKSAQRIRFFMTLLSVEKFEYTYNFWNQSYKATILTSDQNIWSLEI